MVGYESSGSEDSAVVPVAGAQRAVLEGWVRRRSTAQALALRSRIVLKCAEGHSILEVSRRLGVAADTVRTWRRFLERGVDGLCDEPRPGVPRKITDADVERVIVRTLEEKPKNATHWSTRSMAHEADIAAARSRAAAGRQADSPISTSSAAWAPWSMAPDTVRDPLTGAAVTARRAGGVRRAAMSRPTMRAHVT